MERKRITLREKIENFKEWAEHFEEDTQRCLALDPSPWDEKTKNFIISVNKKASEVLNYVVDVLEDTILARKPIKYDVEE